MTLYVTGSGPWRPKPRLSSRAKYAVDVDSRRNWYRSSSPPADSHRQVLEMYQEQPGTETKFKGGVIFLGKSENDSGCLRSKNNHVPKHQDNEHSSIDFFIIRLVAMTWLAASASLGAT